MCADKMTLPGKRGRDREREREDQKPRVGLTSRTLDSWWRQTRLSHTHTHNCQPLPTLASIHIHPLSLFLPLHPKHHAEAWIAFVCVLLVFFCVGNTKLTFYSLARKRRRGEEDSEHICVGCNMCTVRQTSTLGQYVIDWAAGRGLLSPAMVQAGESSVSYMLPLIGNLPWWRLTGAKAELQ